MQRRLGLPPLIVFFFCVGAWEELTEAAAWSPRARFGVGFLPAEKGNKEKNASAAFGALYLLGGQALNLLYFTGFTSTKVLALLVQKYNYGRRRRALPAVRTGAQYSLLALLALLAQKYKY